MEFDEALSDPIWRRVESILHGRVADDDKQWLYYDEGYPQEFRLVFDEEESAQRLAQTVRRLREIGELPRSRWTRQAPDARYAYRVLSDDERTMAAAVTEAMAHRANQREDVYKILRAAARHPVSSEAAMRQLWSGGTANLDKGFVRNVNELADSFGWDAEDAAVALAVGRAPPIEPLRMFLRVREFVDEHDAPLPRSRATIVLELDPWLSQETVVRAYETARQELLGKGKQRPDVRQLEAFRFVLKHLDFNGQPRSGQTWTSIGDEWNQKHDGTDWEYQKPGDIKRAYDSVRAKLVNMQFNIDGTEQRPIPAVGGCERSTVIRVHVDDSPRGPMEPKAGRMGRKKSDS